MTTASELRLTTTEFAELLDCTSRHVQQLARLGVIPKAGRGQWPLAAVTAYIQHLRDAARAGAGLQNARERLAAARAGLLELDIAERRGDLMSVGDAVETWDTAVALLAAELNGLPSGVAPQLVAKGEREIAVILTEHLNAARERLANEVRIPIVRLADQPRASRNGR
jgi:phage terminase Nu1 subunit (DNA packaging protein)